LKEMTDDFTSADRLCNQLLDMIEKKATIVEASFARVWSQMAIRQNYTMMTFKIITVLFLPLSFFTSLFGINVRD
jgi:Mg2+ and Co2+ transporter CorA